MANVETVQDIYAAFGRGDVPAILQKLADDVEWEYGSNSANVPWLQPRRGRDNVAGFFAALANLEFHAFQPKAFFESGNQVVTLVDFYATYRPNGRSLIETDEVHIWTFDSAGRVTRFAHRLDTHQHWATFNSK